MFDLNIDVAPYFQLKKSLFFLYFLTVFLIMPENCLLPPCKISAGNHPQYLCSSRKTLPVENHNPRIKFPRQKKIPVYFPMTNVVAYINNVQIVQVRAISLGAVGGYTIPKDIVFGQPNVHLKILI